MDSDDERNFLLSSTDSYDEDTSDGEHKNAYTGTKEDSSAEGSSTAPARQMQREENTEEEENENHGEELDNSRPSSPAPPTKQVEKGGDTKDEDDLKEDLGNAGPSTTTAQGQTHKDPLVERDTISPHEYYFGKKKGGETDRSQKDYLPAGEPQLRFLDCPMCDNRYCVPKMLPCFHTFCKQCLTKISDSKSITCPLCKDKHSLQNMEVDDLQNNTFILDLIDFFMHAADEPPELLCRMCTNAQSQSYCVHCQILFCGDCKVLHASLPVTESHNHSLMTSDDFRNKVLKTSPFTRAVTCPEHFGEDLNLYCVSCHIPVCSECVHTKHFHADSNPMEISTIIDGTRLKLKDVYGSTCTAVNQHKFLKEIVKNESEVNDAKRHIPITEIESEANAASDRVKGLEGDLRRQESQLTQKLENRYDERKNAIGRQRNVVNAALVKVTKSIEMANSLNDQTNEAAFLLMTTQAFAEWRNLLSVDIEGGNSNKPPLTFSQQVNPPVCDERTGVLGMIKTSDVLSKKGTNPNKMASATFDKDGVAVFGRNMLTDPSDVVVLPDEKIVVTDKGKQQVAVLDRNGVFLQPISQPAPFKPACIVLLGNDTLLITDPANQCIHRLNVERGMFRHAGTFGTNLRPYAIATCDHGLIFVVNDKTNRSTGLEIAVFDQSYKPGRSIPIHGGGVCDTVSLATNSMCDVILLQQDKFLVTLLDFKGCHKGSSKVADSGSVTISSSLAVDQYDNIIVCGWGKVKMYSSELKLVTYIDEVDQSFRITGVAVFPYSPYRLALSDADKVCIKVYSVEDAGKGIPVDGDDL
ncbi:tripartite motif-containing protein 2-like [Ptychodera flava]|uniref:tripartite motif-containing protein 2-like n=1 Tax=Ptychodera flava TaxID=63121 RepID=UPI00396A4756